MQRTSSQSAAPLSRRSFIGRLAAAATVPYLLPINVLGANNRINVAWVGVGSMGGGDVRGASDTNVVALCDVDLNSWNLRQSSERWPEAKVYQDFRKMLEEMGDQIDAVGVSTHDRAHFPVAYMAMKMGKHVFIQKPMTHSVWEGRVLRDLAREKGLITQMGNQGQGYEGIRLVKEWYQAGLIGDVSEIIAWTDRPTSGVGFRETRHEYPPAQDVPEGLDWDLWLGPVTQDLGYNNDIHPFFWRGWWEYGAGALGDIGCHTLNTPVWVLDLPHPERIDVEVKEVNPLYTPDGSIVTYRFAERNGKPPVKITWYESPSQPELPEGYDFPPVSDWGDGGLIMIGEKGVIAHPNMRPGSPRLYPEALWQEFRETPSMRPGRTLPRARGNIVEDWLAGIRDGSQPCSNFEIAAPLNEMVLLGTLAIRTGESVIFDAENMRIPNNPTANALLKNPAREGWDVDSLG